MISGALILRFGGGCSKGNKAKEKERETHFVVVKKKESLW